MRGVATVPWLVTLVALAAPLADAHPIRILAASDVAAAKDAFPPSLVSPPPELANFVRPSLSPRALAPATAGSYSIEFQCPTFTLDLSQYPCPLRVIDEDDLLGNPTLAINPLDPQNIVFSSLHGTLENGATIRSRGEQTHTTFTHGGLPSPVSTAVSGPGWQDQPYTPPSEVGGDDPIVHGEDVHAILDDLGNLYIASLYSHGAGGNDSQWEYTIANWKFDPDYTLNYVFPNGVFGARDPARAIENVWLSFLPAARQVVLLWREVAPAQGAAWVAGAITPADLISPWELLPESLLLGPCSRTTNPAPFGDRIYLGCVAAENLTSVPGTSPGDLLLYEIDPLLGTSRAVSKAPLRGAAPQLAVSAQGRVAVVSVEVVDGVLRAQLTTSRLGEGWSAPASFADQYSNGTALPEEARVNAVLYRGATNTIHLVILERTNTTEAESGKPAWKKSLVVVDPLGALLVNLDLDISDKDEVFTTGFREPPWSDNAYADQRDSLIEFQGREYLLFTDWAVFVFAEIVERDNREDVLAFQNTPPVPEPLPVAEVAVTTINVGAGVVAGTTAAMGIHRLLAARRAAAAGHGRERP